MESSKTIILLLLIGPFISSSPNLPTKAYSHTPERTQIKPVEVLKPKPISISDDIPILIEALIQVESRGNDSAIGDRHLAEPSVGVFIDGVYRSRAGSSISDLPRLERVEVLSGPQSILFGKNASAGVISIVTPKPSGETGGYIEAEDLHYLQIVDDAPQAADILLEYYDNGCN